MTDTIAELRELLGKATAGPWDHMEGMGIVRALRGDVAIPLFETRTPWGDQHHGAPTVRLGGEVVFRANSEGAKTSEALKREWNNAALVAAALNALPALLDRVEAGEAGWQDIATAPKDRTRILVILKNPLPVEGRPDLEPWNGIPFVASHPGVEDDGFDIGWGFAAPVGHGGFPDKWIAGWRPLPEAPQQKADTP